MKKLYLYAASFLTFIACTAANRNQDYFYKKIPLTNYTISMKKSGNRDRDIRLLNTRIDVLSNLCTKTKKTIDSLCEEADVFDKNKDINTQEFLIVVGRYL